MSTTAPKRDRSIKVEYLGRQYDHSNQSWYRGFSMLTMAWSDGHSLVPVDFELLSIADAHKRLGPEPQAVKTQAQICQPELH